MLPCQWISLFCVLHVFELFSETVRNMFGCVCYWMWWSCCVWLEVLYWIDHVWSSIECVCCACGPSKSLDAPSICFLCDFVCRKLSPHLGVWELDHRCLIFLCCFFVWFLHTMSLVKSLQLLCIFPFGMLCLSAISMMFVKIQLAVCILVNCVQSAFLFLVVCSHVVC